MPSGGYRVYDFKGLNITPANIEVPGIHNFFESTHGKPIMLKNVLINGAEISNGIYPLIAKQGTSYFCVISIGSSATMIAIWVSDGDNVRAGSVVLNSGSADMPEEGPSASM